MNKHGQVYTFVSISRTKAILHCVKSVKAIILYLRPPNEYVLVIN